MRTYGRIALTRGGAATKWVEVQTDANGYNDAVYITALIQCLKLNLNESPFWANWGIPAKPSVVQQIAPDYYVALMQQRFSPYFASLIIARILSNPPTYRVNLVTQQGFRFDQVIAV